MSTSFFVFALPLKSVVALSLYTGTSPSFVLLVVLVAQAGVGYAQYFTGVPIGLVAIHLAGSVCVWVAVLAFELGLHTHPAVVGAEDAPEPVADGVAAATPVPAAG